MATFADFYFSHPLSTNGLNIHVPSGSICTNPVHDYYYQSRQSTSWYMVHDTSWYMVQCTWYMIHHATWYMVHDSS